MACRRRAPHSGSTVTEKVGESVRAISAPFRPYLASPVSNPNDSSVNVAQNRPRLPNLCPQFRGSQLRRPCECSRGDRRIVVREYPRPARFHPHVHLVSGRFHEHAPSAFSGALAACWQSRRALRSKGLAGPATVAVVGRKRTYCEREQSMIICRRRSGRALYGKPLPASESCDREAQNGVGIEARGKSGLG